MIQLKYCILTIILSATISKAIAENTEVPNYDGKGTLTIPRVDTSNQIGNYQDAKLQFDANINAWVLQQVNETPINPQNPTVEMVNVFIADNEFPVQVLLQIKGTYSCGDFGQINSRRKDNFFEIQITIVPPPPGYACTADMKGFVRVVPLDVYRLNAGDYQYSVNGGNLGSFSLAKDNKFGECGGTNNPAEICETAYTAVSN
ncbi:MAG TPA: hypothetical protein PLV19_00265 [Nitrosomonas sp.]|nr:hypothetical protein [Nitrosomonas sp.]HQX12594.1 hypothetical protein [Nitrosomonas sp.]HRB32202.1 hypothetical protein [Nitrosomonas sp.]HRB44864.1 hypothetical protein [Nitrosomonas sp.]HRB77135.1 hypothetical protein [Nitrosomonas sp.]